MPEQPRVHIDGIMFSLQRQGGVSVVFREWMQRLAVHGFTATLTLEEPCQQSLDDGEAPGVARQPRAARPLERLRRCRGATGAPADLFHSTYYRVPAVRSMPTVVTVHDFVHERCLSGPRAALHRWLKETAIRHAQAIVCVSHSTRDDLLDLVGQRPGQLLRVVHNGVSDDFNPLPAASTRPEGPPFILYVGSRVSYKNFGLVVQALAFLPDIELHCVGGGAITAADLAHVPPSVRSRVRHLGYLDDAELNLRYNQAACLVYPSAYEGFGIPVVEAMRAGCPVVSLACKAVLEVGAEALIVAPAEPHGFAESIASVLEPAVRARHIALGTLRSAAFSWGRNAQELAGVYREVLEQAGSPR